MFGCWPSALHSCASCRMAVHFAFESFGRRTAFSASSVPSEVATRYTVPNAPLPSCDCLWYFGRRLGAGTFDVVSNTTLSDPTEEDGQELVLQRWLRVTELERGGEGGSRASTAGAASELGASAEAAAGSIVWSNEALCDRWRRGVCFGADDDSAAASA